MLLFLLLFAVIFALCVALLNYILRIAVVRISCCMVVQGDVFVAGWWGVYRREGTSTDYYFRPGYICMSLRLWLSEYRSSDYLCCRPKWINSNGTYIACLWLDNILVRWVTRTAFTCATSAASSPSPTCGTTPSSARAARTRPRYLRLGIKQEKIKKYIQRR